MIIHLIDTLKKGYSINQTLDLSSRVMSLDTAKDIMLHCAEVSGKTLSFSNTLWQKILTDDDAIEILEGIYAKGWSTNEPDIQVTADSGYNGVVRVNSADLQLTQVGSTGFWYGNAPSSVTSLDYFMKHNGNSNYNSTSVNVKTARFGHGIKTKTASCTSINYMFSCNNSDSSKFVRIDVTNLNTSAVTTGQQAFAVLRDNSEGVVLRGIEELDMHSATTLNNMFIHTRVKGGYVDLHKWHVNSSSASFEGMFGSAGENWSMGINTCFYVTPGYWGKNPISNYSAASAKPVPYPYHDFNAAASTSFDGTIKVNNSTVTMTKDNSLGIWYYDLPSGTSVTSLQDMLGTTSAKSYVLSFTIGDKFEDVNVGTLFGAFKDCQPLRSVRIPGLITTGMNQTFNNTTGTSNLTCIFGFDKLSFATSTIYGGEQTFRGCSTIRYINMSAVTYDSSMNYYFNGCTNIRRVSNLPGITSAVGGAANFTGCTSLTTIDNCGPISQTIDFTPAPLSLASAKVILRALQTVVSETCTFSSTTINYILQDEEALQLLEQAKSRGWSFANMNRVISGTVASGVTSIKLRINNNSAKDVTVTCTDGRFAYQVTENITTIRNILSQSSGQVTSIDFSNCDLSTCTEAINTFLNQTVLTKISFKGCDTSNITNWQGCFATNTGTSAIQEIDFSGCTFSGSVTNVQYLFMNATALTTFKTDSNTTILQNWDMSPCSSLTLASAKNVVRALGTVSGKTAAFHANTIALINNNTEALRLVAMARQRGWTISGVNLYGDIRFKVTDSVTSMSFKINASSYDAADNVTVAKDSDGWFRYTIPENVTLTSLCGAFNQKSNIDRVVLESTLPTANLTDMNRFVRYANNMKYMYINCETGNVTNWARACNSEATGDRLRSISLNRIKSGSTTTNMFLNQTQLTEITACAAISESIDFSPCPLTLASAKIVLQSLQTVTSETCTFSSTTLGYINADSDAKELVLAAIGRGWNIPGASTPYGTLRGTVNTGSTYTFTINSQSVTVPVSNGAWSYALRSAITSMNFNEGNQQPAPSNRLTTIDFSDVDTSNVSDFSYMFYGCTGLQSIDMSQIDTSSALYYNDMFNGCTSLATFSGAFSTSPTHYMRMFRNCTSLRNLDLSWANLRGNKNIVAMFEGNTNFTLRTDWYFWDQDHQTWESLNTKLFENVSTVKIYYDDYWEDVYVDQIKAKYNNCQWIPIS